MFDKPFGDERQHAPATQRNADYIIDVLKEVLPAKGHILEIASGSGEHVVSFAEALPDLSWQPSDPFEGSRTSIDSWAQDVVPSRIASALDLDMLTASWDSLVPKEINAVIAINMIHIAPWEACCGLMAGAGQLLNKGEVLYTYGPYRQNGLQTSKSNENFEVWLKSKDERYGVRDIDEVAAEAGKHNLTLDKVIKMPANNFSLIFKKV